MVVLDGVSPLRPEGPRDGWYPDALGQRILDLLDSDPSADLPDVLATAIDHVSAKHSLVPGESPASTVAILRWDDQHIDGLVLGDSPIVVFGQDGGVDVLRDGRHEAVVAELRRAARQTTEGFDTLDDLIRATRPAKLARMNHDGGYWIAEAMPEAGHHAILRRWPINSVHAVAAMTDGVSCGVDDYGLPPSWPAALTLALNDGLQALLAVIHEAEATDKDRQRWPRPKTHDDKAAALVVFPQADMTRNDEQ
ncbi:protein phosphatase 2C domain-containing protein [Actinomadura sp. NEAU-AAG7]|uniref:protein phosphatase 2C domain-containing protein n=1 Tax=Actinomadura sp. NEAU-AAG7 TaxID=2839640 RepID=UPI001BE4E164|nr:protein phosphatase 2C domain-containing protein [Actinomadura sp. NEAU-AAG7]MBT2208697.1 protein phosphatase 2C domain-containing protein [Actinomadura sp. NEAU-AAG7]